MKSKSMYEISTLFANTSNADLINEFMNQILTKDEIQEISKRWELLKLLNEGISQRNIAKKMKISLCKITRGSKELKKKNSTILKFINQSKELNDTV